MGLILGDDLPAIFTLIGNLDKFLSLSQKLSCVQGETSYAIVAGSTLLGFCFNVLQNRLDCGFKLKLLVVASVLQSDNLFVDL